MTTLDEVIDELQYWDTCDEYPECFYDCEVTRDALHYLREYRDCGECAYADSYLRCTKEDRNDPLSWDQLQKMEGKPVWIKWTKTEESYWCFVGEWFDDDEMRIYHIGRDYADYIHKTVYTPDIVQAYRKERAE